MRFTRLFSATLLVAAVTLLGSCGESATPTTAVKDPALDLGNREFTLAPGFVSWERDLDSPLPTDTKSVMIQGTIAVATYPSFGPIVYEGDGSDWLEFIKGPSAESFSRAPLGWNVGFKLKPSAADLGDGPHTATIEVNVPAALNNPQFITVSYGCNLLSVDGEWREGELDDADPRWNRYDDEYNTDSDGGFLYDDWCIRVPAFASVRLEMQGSPCSNPDYSLTDPYTFVFTVPDHEYVDQDDDGGCGYNSVLYFDNESGSEQPFLVRATAYGQFEESDDDDGGSDNSFGTYRIRAELEAPGLREKTPPQREVGDKPDAPRTARSTR